MPVRTGRSKLRRDRRCERYGLFVVYGHLVQCWAVAVALTYSMWMIVLCLWIQGRTLQLGVPVGALGSRGQEAALSAEE